MIRLSGYCFGTTFSWTEKEKEAREEIWQNVLEEEQKKGTSIKYAEYPEEALKARTQLPSQIVGSTKNYTKMAGGGISWPGTFTPANKWAPVYNKWKEILIEHNLSPSVRATNYRGVTLRHAQGHDSIQQKESGKRRKTREKRLSNVWKVDLECRRHSLQAPGGILPKRLINGRIRGICPCLKQVKEDAGSQ